MYTTSLPASSLSHLTGRDAGAMGQKPRVAFFGTPDFAVWVLDALESCGVLPDLVVCAPDAPKGRKLVMTPPAAKVWAEARGIRVIQPEKIRTPEFETELRSFAGTNADGTPAGWDLFIVAAYGKIIPENILYLPKRHTINVHPSLLPLLRGSSPLQSAILADMRDTGTTIMLLDKEMDHGPILAQEKAELAAWPVDHVALGKLLAAQGGRMIARLLPDILAGTAKATEQDHAKATYTKKISKEDGLIDLSADGYQNWLRFNAYKGWPGSFFFVDKGGKQTRVSITEATYENGAFAPLTVVPEGKKPLPWLEFKRGL